MKATANWHTANDIDFGIGSGRHGCAHLTHYTVNYVEWGEGPPLVLIPGLAGGYGLLGPLAKLLARDYRVISYNLRGEDDSFALRQPFDLDDLVDDLEEFLNWHYLESPTVFGISFGGILGLKYAVRHPYRLDNLILHSVGARYERTLIQRIAGIVLSRFPLPTDSPFVNQFFNLLFGSKMQDKELFEFVTRQCWRTDQSVMAHRFGLVQSYNMEKYLHRVRVPSLILSGEKDLLVSPGSLSALHTGLQDVELVRLAEAGHLGFVTHPDRMAREIRRFTRLQATADCS